MLQKKVVLILILAFWCTTMFSLTKMSKKNTTSAVQKKKKEKKSKMAKKEEMLQSIRERFSVLEDADFLKGVWLIGSKTAKLEFYKNENGKFDGKIIWLKQPIDKETGLPLLDQYNPDTLLRKRPMMGLVSFQNFEYVGHGLWDHGTGYDPSNGKTYKGFIYMDIGHLRVNSLSMKGYIGISLLGRKSVWTRVGNFTEDSLQLNKTLK